MYWRTPGRVTNYETRQGKNAVGAQAVIGIIHDENYLVIRELDDHSSEVSLSFRSSLVQFRAQISKSVLQVEFRQINRVLDGIQHLHFQCKLGTGKRKRLENFFVCYSLNDSRFNPFISTVPDLFLRNLFAVGNRLIKPKLLDANWWMPTSIKMHYRLLCDRKEVTNQQERSKSRRDKYKSEGILRKRIIYSQFLHVILSLKWNKFR